MSKELEGRVALVTGAARNIGRAIALDLANAGAALVLNARSASPELQAVADRIVASGGRAITHAGDVSAPDDVAALVAAGVAAFGRLDILVCNAAIRRETPFAQLDYAAWRDVVSVILDGAYLCAHAALPHLERSDAGAIVTIGGMSAHSGSANRAHVIAAKAGVVGLTRALAHDLGPAGITVNCVVPGLIETVRGPSTGGEPAHHAHKTTLIGRRARPEEVASAVRYLVGPGARAMTGQTLHVNGGAYLSN
jgi:3-oxoacyl-[acyl-carrier protein] reductase